MAVKHHQIERANTVVHWVRITLQQLMPPHAFETGMIEALLANINKCRLTSHADALRNGDNSPIVFTALACWIIEFFKNICIYIYM